MATLKQSMAGDVVTGRCIFRQTLFPARHEEPFVIAWFSSKQSHILFEDKGACLLIRARVRFEDGSGTHLPCIDNLAGGMSLITTMDSIHGLNTLVPVLRRMMQVSDNAMLY